MEISIDCPDCGYNYYSAEDRESKDRVTLMVGKCSATECELTIEYSNGLMEDQTYPDMSELKDYVYLKYTILSKEDCGCVN